MVMCLGSGADGAGFESSLCCLLPFFFFFCLFFSSSFFSKYFYRIYSVGNGRPAAESIATAKIQTCDVTRVLQSDLIGPSRSVCADPKRYWQSPRPSLRVFILNAAVGAVWLARLHIQI